jgi:glycosyltransferase involved in cell wall biosynthesis
MPPIKLSIVLAVYNEEENILRLHAELKQALTALGQTYEIIYVDDGSKDASFQRLSQVASDDPSVTVIRFRRNYGQTAALSAGINHSQGEIIILMDADLQNDPADIQHLLEKMEEGYDVVSGWRKHRQDQFLKRKLPSKLANALISKVTGVHLHDYGCTLKAYRREVLKPVRLYGEMHRFIPAYAFWSGALITEIPVNHRARQFGKSKYGLSRTLRVLLDLITVKFLGGYSTKPLYAFGFVGALLMLASLVSAFTALGQSLLPPYVRLHNNPLTLLGAILMVLAIQIILMGLLAELIMRTYYESQGKPTYIIRTVLSSRAADDTLRQNGHVVSSAHEQADGANRLDGLIAANGLDSFRSDLTGSRFAD